jgi:hypothetical protein
MREIHSVAVVDLERELVVWLQQGPWGMPHQPTVLEDGQLLVFDNMGHQGFSRVVEFDPLARELTWQYAGDPPESLFSIFSGSAQRLPGGNTLICNGVDGRVFEVTPKGKVVWDYRNPYGREPDAPAGGAPPRSLFRATRLARDHPGLAGRGL